MTYASQSSQSCMHATPESSSYLPSDLLLYQSSFRNNPKVSL